MVKISACIIAKNEESTIGNLLSSIQDIVDEIIVVDTGSTDRTKEVVSKFTNNIYDFKWIDDFAKARNYSFEKATGNWIIWLDSDDVFVEEDRIKFKKLKKETLPTTDVDVFDFWYNYRHNENGECTYRFMRNRLIRNNKGFHWDYPIHEALLVHGKFESTDITVTHTNNHDNGKKYIEFFDRKIANEGYVLRQRDLYYYGGELSIHGFKDRAIEVFNKFFSMGRHDNSWEEKRACDFLIDIYIDKCMWDEALKIGLKRLYIGYIDPEIYYKIGKIMKNLNRKDEAMFYYRIPVDMESYFPNIESSFVLSQYDGCIFNSALELVCMLYYDNKISEASKYHEICKKMRPNDDTVKFNDQFFSGK